MARNEYVQIRIPVAAHENLQELADRSGLPKSMFVAWALDGVRRALDSEQDVTWLGHSVVSGYRRSVGSSPIAPAESESVVQTDTTQDIESD